MPRRPALLALCVIGLLLVPMPAWADNCATLADCYATSQAFVASTVAVAVVVTALTIGMNLPGRGAGQPGEAKDADEALDAAAQGASGSGSRGGSSGSGSGSNRVPDIPQQPPAPKPQPMMRDAKGVDVDKLRNIVNNLWHKHDSATRIGDGTTMSAVRNELRTGRPTNTKYHIGKAKQTAKDLGEWLRNNPGASKHNRNIAENLVRRLNNALHTKRPY